MQVVFDIWIHVFRHMGTTVGQAADGIGEVAAGLEDAGTAALLEVTDTILVGEGTGLTVEMKVAKNVEIEVVV